MSHARWMSPSTTNISPTKICFFMSELTDNPSLPRTPVHPSQPPAAETKANLTQSLEVGGRGIHEVGRWGSVTEEIPCLIFTGLPNWTLLKDELCSWPTSCERDWRPPSLTHNHQRGSAGVGSLIKPGGGPLLIVAGPDFSCDNRRWLQLW